MSFRRKGILSFALFIGICTIVLLLFVSCLPSTHYGTEEEADAAAPYLITAAGGQQELPAVQVDELPAEAEPVTVPAAVPSALPEALPEAVPDAVPGAEPEQDSNVGTTLFHPLSEDTKPVPSSVTTNTYVPIVPPKNTGKTSSKVSIPVLNYHSVAIDPGNIVVISPDKLEAQMAYLHDHGYTPLSLDAFIRLLEGDTSEKAPEKPILLTFDDGYLDNYEQAMPILAKYGFPATLFVSPGMTEQDGYLNWDQIKKMQAGGWDIQPHGMSHPHLPKLTADEQAYEIVEARKQIEEHLGTKADIFCYPYGERNKTTLKLLKQHGFRYAFTIDQGYATNEQSPFLLKRLFVNGEEDLQAFEAQLLKRK
ncbi:polysaccharide deacetylase family protein [Paenibacillus chondroitinus]|uniref:Polysaccharide deacetylase family protein n=1 Tax=Paenibacillus chondroitinus TaxID=59842 RepID=A0ABU6D7B7_9BACL|nr:MULTISPECIES: polysaccharide deacetylase family protein [Paenibacillus]MCY9661945.1 polysaccharide deacetylase family protein [Paenibacillus anseongense]MEB4793631.1 polysaccharide deacetylase family protein [Paenibacillus chondroitinus]